MQSARGSAAAPRPGGSTKHYAGHQDSSATLPGPPSKTASAASLASASASEYDQLPFYSGRGAPAPVVTVTDSSKSRMPPPLPGHSSLHGSLANLNLGSMDRLGEDEEDAYESAEEEFQPSAQTMRKSAALEVYMYDHYMNLYTFLGDRKARTARFKEQMQQRGIAPTSAEYQTRWKLFLEKEREMLRKRRTRTKAKDFTILSQIGQGGYGSVYLARKSTTDEVVALKKMSKTLLHRLGEVDHILTERDILTQARSQWLVKLLYSFQDPDNVYLAMEYVPGGDIRTLLNLNPGPIAEQHCKFYLAEMLLGVNALHEMGYIHRDLKPENFLIDIRGHVKLTDFGLAKGRISDQRMESMKIKLRKISHLDVVPRSFKENKSLRAQNRAKKRDVLAMSLVGSPDYMAPEVLQHFGGGYDFRVDYWSLGTILFEFLVGYPPFQGANSDEVWNNVLNWNKILARPDEEVRLSDAAWNMVTGLINFKSVRLASVREVQEMEWMREMRFENLGNPSGPKPPFIPQLDHALDTKHFDDFSDPSQMAIYAEVQEKRAETEMQAEKLGKPGKEDEEKMGIRRGFIGFTFRARDGEALVRASGVRKQVSAKDLFADTYM